MKQTKLRPVAFFLPQYHPISENDRWWGKGFTEWTNVVRARPLFPKHYQPHIPADLGFYDLRLNETRAAQAELAQSYGIFGFAYYHYWFKGRRLLNRPIDDILKSPSPSHPFCLCWANESWTRRWDGLESELLMRQEYDRDDDINHIKWLNQVFCDSRYIRVGNKPLFLIYKASKIPDVSGFLMRWREQLYSMGKTEAYFCKVESNPNEKGDPQASGFDASIEFQPDWENLGSVSAFSYLSTLLAARGNLKKIRELGLVRTYSYPSVVKLMIERPPVSYFRYPCVMPAWDNSARRILGSMILKDSTPDCYGHWLDAVLDSFRPRTAEENFVFINAWNEWGEGCHLEPCLRWERGYLEATKKALDKCRV